MPAAGLKAACGGERGCMVGAELGRSFLFNETDKHHCHLDGCHLLPRFHITGSSITMVTRQQLFPAGGLQKGDQSLQSALTDCSRKMSLLCMFIF